MANTHSIDLEASSLQALYIFDATQTGLDLSGDHTVECWVNMESLPSSGNYMMLFNKHGASGSFGYLWGIYNDGGTYKLKGGVSSSGVDFDFKTSDDIAITTGTWYHLAVSFDASEHSASFYKNGSLVSTDSSGSLTSINNNNQNLFVGCSFQGSYASFLDGKMDELKIYSDVRTASEISQDRYSSPATGDNLVLYCPLNNSGDDESGNNNDLLLLNAPSYSTTVPFTNYGNAGGAFLYQLLS